MSLLVCTADIPSSVIEDFIEEQNRYYGYPNDWWLLREPNQKFPLKRGRGDQPPIEPFDTGFKSWDIKRLRDFMLPRLQQEDTEDKGDTFSFAVLDERSIKDRTVEVHFAHHWLPDETDEDHYDHKWFQWRVRFRTATIWCLKLRRVPFHPLLEGKEEHSYVDSEGVLQFPQDERNKNFFSGLKEEDMAPFQDKQAAVEG